MNLLLLRGQYSHKSCRVFQWHFSYFCKRKVAIEFLKRSGYKITEESSFTKQYSIAHFQVNYRFIVLYVLYSQNHDLEKNVKRKSRKQNPKSIRELFFVQNCAQVTFRIRFHTKNLQPHMYNFVYTYNL